MPQTIVFCSLQGAAVWCHSMSLMVFVWRHVQKMSLETTPLGSVNHVSACHFYEINIYQFDDLLAFMDTD